MPDAPALMPVLLTLLMQLGYLLWLWTGQRGGRAADAAAWARHARLREDWLRAVSAQPGSELLAIQTLRNSMMSATMSASTAVLGLMGALGMTLPGLHEVAAARQLLELVLLLALLGSLLCSGLALRSYHHAGFVAGMPVASALRQRWAPTGEALLRRGGLLYGWGLRCLLLCLPLLAALLQPWAGPPTALLLWGALYAYEHRG